MEGVAPAVYVEVAQGYTRLQPHEVDIIKRMVQMPRADRHIKNILTELRAGLYQSDYSESRGDPAQPHRDKCVIAASLIKDRDERGPENPLGLEERLGRTVDQALARLREDS